MGTDSSGLDEAAKDVEWEEVTREAAWSKRDSMGAVVFNDRMWLLGGYTPKRVNDVWYSSDGVNWYQATGAAPWGGRNLPCSIVYDGKIWVIGGIQPQPLKTSYNDVWYSLDGATWEQATGNAPWSRRGAASSVVFKGKMWVIGGFEDGTFTHNSDVWSSHDGRTWEQVTAKAPWSPRAMHTSVVFKGKMWVIGGGVYNTAYPHNIAGNYNDVWYSSDGEEWVEVTAAAEWAPRRFHCSEVYNGKIWVLSGYHYGNRNDVWYSSDGKNWREAKPGAPWTIRHAPVCLVFKDRLWVIGGYGQTLYNDVWACKAKP